MGKHITLLIPSDKIREEDYILGQIRQGKRVDHFEILRRAKDGRLVDVSITVSPIRDSGGSKRKKACRALLPACLSLLLSSSVFASTSTEHLPSRRGSAKQARNPRRPAPLVPGNSTKEKMMNQEKENEQKQRERETERENQRPGRESEVERERQPGRQQ